VGFDSHLKRPIHASGTGGAIWTPADELSLSFKISKEFITTGEQTIFTTEPMLYARVLHESANENIKIQINKKIFGCIFCRDYLLYIKNINNKYYLK